VIGITDVKKGTVLKIEGDIYSVVDFQHVKPGKGGAFLRTKLKNIMRETVLERTFKQADKLEDVQVERRRAQFLYKDEENFIFMDTQNFEQEHVPPDIVGDNANFLLENMEVDTGVYENRTIFLNLPIFVELKVVETEPGIKGDTVSGATKPAILETGYKVTVPLFINEGEILKIDTRTGEYVERVSH